MHKLITIASVGFLIFTFLVALPASAQVDVTIDAETSVSDADMDAVVGTDASDMNQDAADDSEVASDTDSTLSLTKEDALSASIDAESAELSADAVVTSEDLSRFATSRMKRDTNIERIDASNDLVLVEYRKKAHFLGFIPASLRTTAEVMSDGTVEVDYPWYRFLFSIDEDQDGAELQARVDEIMASANLSTGMNAHTSAQLIAALHTALQGSLTAGFAE